MDLLLSLLQDPDDMLVVKCAVQCFANISFLNLVPDGKLVQVSDGLWGVFDVHKHDSEIIHGIHHGFMALFTRIEQPEKPARPPKEIFPPDRAGDLLDALAPLYERELPLESFYPSFTHVDLDEEHEKLLRQTMRSHGPVWLGPGGKKHMHECPFCSRYLEDIYGDK